MEITYAEVEARLSRVAVDVTDAFHVELRRIVCEGGNQTPADARTNPKRPLRAQRENREREREKKARERNAGEREKRDRTERGERAEKRERERERETYGHNETDSRYPPANTSERTRNTCGQRARRQSECTAIC